MAQISRVRELLNDIKTIKSKLEDCPDDDTCLALYRLLIILTSRLSRK